MLRDLLLARKALREFQARFCNTTDDATFRRAMRRLSRAIRAARTHA